MPTQLHHSSLMCSDIDTKSLYDVVEGPDSDFIITNKHIISQYNLSSRRHLDSWTSKSWEPYTSGAVYCVANNSIIGVIASHVICIFSLEKDDSYKHKFSSEIFKLTCIDDEVLVIFQTGLIEPLSKALESRKTSKHQIIDSGETIIDVNITSSTNKIAYLTTKTTTAEVKLYIIHYQEDATMVIKNTVLIKRKGLNLNTLCITPENNMLSLWSNNELCLTSVTLDIPPVIPGKVIYTTQHINPIKPVKIVGVSPTHALIVGLDIANEGSCMILLDTKFGVVNSVKRLKMYREPPLAWVVASGIIVVEAGCLTFVPYTLDQSNISTMFSSKIINNVAVNQRDDSMITMDHCCSWPLNAEMSSHEADIPKQAILTIHSNTSSALSEIITSLTLGSLTQSFSSKEVINHLISKNDQELLNEALRVFSNIPEESLIAALKFFMSNSRNKDDVDQEGDSSPFTDKIARNINLVLSKAVTPVGILKHLCFMDFDQSCLLVKHLDFLIKTQTGLVKDDLDVPTIEQTCTWFNTLLDANYTKLVMSTEPNVSQDLTQALSNVSFMDGLIEEVIEVQPMINRILRGKDVVSSQASAPYSMERLVIDFTGNNDRSLNSSMTT